MIEEFSAGAVLYRGQGSQREFLIVQGIKNHRWGFAKGHLQPGETTQAAARREVKEETGLQPDFDFSFSQKTQYRAFSGNLKQVTYYLAKADPGKKVVPQASEIEATRWVTLAEAPQYLTVHGKMGVLQKAQAFLQKKKLSSEDGFFS